MLVVGEESPPPAEHGTITRVKRVVEVKLLPDGEEFDAILGTLELCNSLANTVAEYAHRSKNHDKYALQQAMYTDVKAGGLSAQPAIRVIKKVADAYTTLKSNLKNGNYGEPGSKRYEKAAGKPVQFRKYSAQPFDDRCLSWQMDSRTVSIWTIHGRLKGIPFVGHPDQLADLQKFRKGETDLVLRDGNLYLIATLDEPAPPPITPVGVVGVDLGIVNIAVTSNGTFHAGEELNKTRERYQRIRTTLQKKGTKSAKRRLKTRRRKEARFIKDTNHVVSKKIVAEVERTGHGIALEELTGIRERVRLRKPQRAKVHSWSFRQLGDFIAYKAEQKGIPVVFVDPRNTSRMCSSCGYIDRKNRKDQETFLCRECGVSLHADYNGSLNISVLGHSQLSLDAAPSSLPVTMRGTQAPTLVVGVL